MKQTTQGTTVLDSVSTLISCAENRYKFAESQTEAALAILDAVCVLCELERAPEHQDSHPSHNIRTGGGFAHGRRVFDSTLSTLIDHAHYLVTSSSDEYNCIHDDVVEVLKCASVDGESLSRYGAFLQRLHGLCDEGVLVLSSKAGKPAADDAKQFISRVAEQMCGESNRG